MTALFRYVDPDTLNVTAIYCFIKSHMNMRKFRITCLNFYTNSVMDIVKRFPIEDEFLKKLEVFSAPKALFDSNRLSTFEDVLFISKKLGRFDEKEFRKTGPFYQRTCHFCILLEHKILMTCGKRFWPQRTMTAL